MAQHDFSRAAELSGAGDSFGKTLRAPVQQGPYYAEIRRGAAETCRQELGDERFGEIHRCGTRLSVAEAIAVAKGEVAERVPGSPVSPLTKRELEIAGLVAAGLVNREIAERLVLPKRTVDAHVEHIFGKLGFNSRAQVAAWFSRQQS